MRVSEKFLVRADYRQYLTGKPFGGSQGLPVSGSLEAECDLGWCGIYTLAPLNLYTPGQGYCHVDLAVALLV